VPAVVATSARVDVDVRDGIDGSLDRSGSQVGGGLPGCVRDLPERICGLPYDP
jgi:hypothetical protein